MVQVIHDRTVKLALIPVVGLLLMAAAPRGIWWPGEQAGRGISYEHPAGWDTVVVILSTQTRPEIAGIDTFSLPTGHTAEDRARIYELNDYVRGRGAKSWRDGDGDAAVVYRIGAAAGAGADFPTFAYTEIDSLKPLGFNAKYVSGLEVQLTSPIRNTATYGGTAVINLSTVALTDTVLGKPHFELVYVPFEDIIPANSTIVSASINTASSGNYYWAAGDTMIATLMDNPNDQYWYTQKGIPDHADWGEASWRRQKTSAYGAGAVNANPWVPELNLRTKVWDYGKVSDWTGSTETGGGFIPTQRNKPIRITNCVQAAVNGRVNNGLLLSYHENNPAAYVYRHYNWDRLSNTTVNNRTPYIVIKYITKKYQSPYPSNSDIAVQLSTDDFIVDNDDWIPVFQAHGAKYTIFGSRVHVDAANIYQADMGKILDWRNAGMEIGTHSYYHKLTYGLAFWEQQAGSITQAVLDSISRDARPDWLYALADSADGNRRESDPLFGKSIALPNNQYSGAVLNAIAAHDYKAMRAVAMGTYDLEKYFAAPTYAPTRGDSIMSGAPSQSGRKPRNMLGMPTTMPIQWIVSTKATFPTMAQVRNNMSRLLFQIRGQDRGEIVLFWHEKKTDGPGWYSEGVNADELDAMLDAVDEFGAVTMTAADLGRWRRANGRVVATPEAFAQPDSFKFNVADQVWFVPDGVDNRWIRGVRAQ